MCGVKIAVIEVDKLGGVCLNRGCIPSKTLIATAHQYQKMRESTSLGINLATPPTYDWKAMRARKDKVVSGLVGGIGQLFKSHGVDHFPGYGKLIGKNKVLIAGEDGNELTLEAANIIIATGSRAANIPPFPVDGIRILNSDHMFELDNLPKSILIIGAGVIGCEWACMLSMLDVQVTVVEALNQALPMEDANSSKLLEREFKKSKIKLHTGTMVESLQPGPEGLQARLSNGQTVDANQALVAVGRAFNTEDIGLEDVGVKLNKNGSVKTSADMRTNINNIFAIGDVRGEVLLAYTAVHDGAVAVDNALGGKSKKNYLGVPSVIFTHPEIASVGMRETEAAEKCEIATGRFPMRALGKAHAENEIAGETYVIADKKTDKLLGVHICGPHATEIIHTAALAINQGLTATQLGSLIFGHPVISESIMEAVHDLHGQSVHLAKKR
jgi:dihydrolipoamide dehydrogenase